MTHARGDDGARNAIPANICGNIKDLFTCLERSRHTRTQTRRNAKDGSSSVVTVTSCMMELRSESQPVKIEIKSIANRCLGVLGQLFDKDWLSLKSSLKTLLAKQKTLESA